MNYMQKVHRQIPGLALVTSHAVLISTAIKSLTQECREHVYFPCEDGRLIGNSINSLESNDEKVSSGGTPLGRALFDLHKGYAQVSSSYQDDWLSKAIWIMCPSMAGRDRAEYK